VISWAENTAQPAAKLKLGSIAPSGQPAHQLRQAYPIPATQMLTPPKKEKKVNE
jgi:hypothetical protein